jgi:CheY-like chemotaxis protein
MSGVDLTSKIKNKNPLFPVIALTSSKDFMNMSVFDGKIDKPINKLNVFNSIHKIIKQNINESGFVYEGDSDKNEDDEDDGSKHNYEQLEIPTYLPFNSTRSKSDTEIDDDTNTDNDKPTSFIKKMFRSKSRSVRKRAPKILSRINTTPKNVKVFNKDIRILIAEDVIYNQNLLDNMLRSLGYNNIFVASDGQETIEKLDEAYETNNPFELLLLDIRMPKMDGYDVIEHVNFKKYPLPKIIAVTASVLQEDRDKCKNLGVEYFITKPINLNKLKNVILRASQFFM